MAAQVDVEGYFDQVISNVGYKWKDLAQKLGFKRGEIKEIETTESFRSPSDRCREALERWSDRNASEATLQVLQQALIKIGERKTAESLAGAAAPPSASGGNDSHQIVGTPRGSSTDVPMTRQGAAAPNSGSGGQDSHPKAQSSQQTATSTPVGGADVSMSLQGHKPIILLINDEYGTSKGGVSTINCEVGQTLAAAGAIVYATALRVPDRDQKAADDDDVKLIKPYQREGDKTEPSIGWLAFQFQTYYPKSKLPQHVDVIIGHADITDTAARNIKDDYYQEADLMTFNHVIPEDTEYYKGGRKAMKAWEKEKDMLHKVDNAKAAFSVGKRIFDHFQTKYKGDKRPQSHYIFLPKPSDMFLAKDVRPGGEQKSVLSVGRVRNAEKQKGHDLAAQSMRDVIRRIPNVLWGVRGISEDDYEVSMQILRDNLDCGDLNPTLRCYGTQQDILDDMMTAHLVLMPSRSEPFGLVGLEAIAAGIPVLISDKTGLAWMIKDLIDQGKLHPDFRHVIVETSVNDNDPAGDAKRWADKIVEILTYNDSEFEKAARFKNELVESRYWEESHRTFLQACGITAGDATAGDADQ